MDQDSIPLLKITDGAVALSKALIAAGAVPEKALGDALHTALSAAHGIDYLLTWNCRHIDNAETKPIVQIKDDMAREYGYNLDALAVHLRNCESQSNRTVVDLQAAKNETDQAPPANATTPRG